MFCRAQTYRVIVRDRIRGRARTAWVRVTVRVSPMIIKIIRVTKNVGTVV